MTTMSDDVEEKASLTPADSLTESTTLIAKPEVDKKHRKWTKQQWTSLIIICIGNFFAGNCVSVQGPFFPREAENKGASPTAYGFVFAVYQMSFFIGSPICAKILGVISPTFVLNSGQFILSSTTILFSVIDKAPDGTPFLALAFVIRSIEGLGAAAFATSGFSLVAALFPDNVATTFATVQTIFGIGLIVGPTLGGALYEIGGFTLPFAAIGSCLFCCCLLSIFLVRPPERSIEKKNKGGFLQFWMNPMPLVVSLAIVCNFINIGYNSTILEPHIRQFNLSPVLVGTVFIVSAIIYSITSPFCGKLCDKMEHPEKLCLVGLCFQCIYLLFVGPAPFLPLDTKLWILILSLVVFGFGISGVLVPGFTGVLKDTLSFIGPSLGGYLEDVIGFRKGTFFLLVITIVMFFVFFGFLFWRGKQQEPTLQETSEKPNKKEYDSL